MRRLFLALLTCCFTTAASAQETYVDWTVKTDSNHTSFLDSFSLPPSTLRLDLGQIQFKKDVPSTITPFLVYDNAAYDGTHQTILGPGVKYSRGNFSVRAVAFMTHTSDDAPRMPGPVLKSSGTAIDYSSPYLPPEIKMQAIRRNDSYMFGFDIRF